MPKKTTFSSPMMIKAAKGSHGKIFVGDRATTIIGANKVMRAGLYRAVCKQLGIDPKELEKF